MKYTLEDAKEIATLATNQGDWYAEGNRVYFSIDQNKQFIMYSDSEKALAVASLPDLCKELIDRIEWLEQDHR